MGDSGLTPETLAGSDSPTAATSKPVKTPVKISMTPSERKALRAKRFGSTDSSISKGSGNKGVSDEVLKKRAERFGVSATTGKGEAGGPDVELLKKRAQRFGVISDKVKKIDHLEKLRKREQRFVSS